MKTGNDAINNRRNEILKIISSSNFVTIDAICQALHLTESTVRRDVRWLIQQNKAKPFHGGVSPAKGPNILFGVRYKRNVKEKELIGRYAASLIEENDFIYIGAGSSTYYFAKALATRSDIRNVTIVTGTVNIALCFSGAASSFTIILLGGILTQPDESLTSRITIDNIKRFNFTKSITGHEAVAVSYGITSNRVEVVEIDQCVFEHSAQHIVLADHTKIGNACSMVSLPFKDITELIVDDSANAREELKKYTGSKVKITLLDPESEM
ncbi:MAG: DeoR/GlpR family DNA-binding transcription regulator [Oscillospiraceae bacterium]|nr:DeoR/GlpR family DNA-binding transcription regulator [Oscillospiraceae bacterium]